VAAPLNAGFPDNGLDLGGGYSVEFTALNATTGNDDSGVKISLACLTVENLSSTTSGVDLSVGPFQLIPFDDLNPPGGAAA
jgi:hypothetical protein